MDHVVIVGASLAGLRAAEALRDVGFDGAVTILGAEARLPYDRPPLSKQILAGVWEPDQAALGVAARYAELRLDFRLGTAAQALDLQARRIAIAGGESVNYDGLIIATGASPRTLPHTPRLNGIFTLRTLDDSIELGRRLAAKPRVVVVGAGFIGMEVAATARERGAQVTMIEALPVPFQETHGAEMGAACAAFHRDHGVDLRCERRVIGFVGEQQVEGVLLDGGVTIPADLVVVGIGVTPNTAWLESSGLALDNGVRCDSCLAASAPDVYAAGDVARWHNELFDEEMRVEHWSNAADQGEHAAKNLVGGADAATPFAPAPYFWSDQYDVKIQFAGIAGHDEVRVVNGTVEERRFVAIYRHGERIVGALAVNWPRLLMAYSGFVERRASWQDALDYAARA